MGVPWIGICQSSGKGRKTTQYAPSTVKDLTSARTQNVLSSSNMAKPIKSSSRKTGMVMWSIKVVEDAPSLFPVLLEVHGVPARPSRGSCLLRRYTHTCQTKRKSSPTLRCRTISSKEPKFKTIWSSEAVDFGRPEDRRCKLAWAGENNRLSPRHEYKISNLKAKISKQSSWS